MLPRALKSVFAQEAFDDFEVIVVDDGSDPPASLDSFPEVPLRLIRIDHQGVGAARATGLAAARGELVAYCDDDDEWTRDHLATLAGYLTDHPEIDLVYGDSEWPDGDSRSVPFSFDYDVFMIIEGNFIFPTDVMHRRKPAVAAGGFDSSLEAYEDWDLWLRMSQYATLRHLSSVIGVRYWHPGCESEKGNWKAWERVTLAHRKRIECEGVAPGHRLQPAVDAPVVPFDQSTWRDGHRELIWHTILSAHKGYGTVARQLIRAVERQGVDITLAPYGNQVPRGFERFAKPLTHLGKLAFHYHYHLRPGELRCERVITYFMWETTMIPSSYIQEINTSSVLLYVPCEQNLESFRECGVTIPIKVLHHGVDQEMFPFLDRPPREMFTFGTFGAFSSRKGIDVLIRAFEQEFAPHEAVQLLLKTNLGKPPYAIRDPRIKLICRFMRRDELLEFLQEMDAFVMPSRGEGFGMCGIEAMSTGLPLIATNWGGTAEYLSPSDSFPIAFRLVDVVPSGENLINYSGQWAEPDCDHLRSVLRWLFEHPAEAREKGRLASKRVQEEWTWDRPAKQMCEDLSAVAAL